MTYDEKKAKKYNEEYDGFSVIYRDGSWKLYSKYGNALNAWRRSVSACKLTGIKLGTSIDEPFGTEVVLSEKH